MTQQAFPHLKRLNLGGVLHEAAIVKTDEVNGDIYFIRIDHLDEVDRSRMRTILSKRDAAKSHLWDLMDQTTLPNGVNALEYFDQYVTVLAQSGKTFKPQMGRMGAPVARRAEDAPKKKKDEAPKT